MSNVNLYPHQIEIIRDSTNKNLVGYFLDMGLGKTYLGAEKLNQLNANSNLVICQKSKIYDWITHFKTNYPELNVIDYTKFKGKIEDLSRFVIVVNYELAFRRPELSTLKDFTLLLDESSLIQNENAKRSKYILKLKPKNVILLSGTPTSGKYEKLWSQCQLVGWKISKREFYRRYIIEREIKIKNSPFPIKIVVGYKNVEELKFMLRHYGCYFLKTEDVLQLPEQTFVKIDVDPIPSYKRFQKDRIVEVDGKTLIGDTALTRMLYERQLCSQYNKNKLEAFADLLDSTEDRLIVFYNYNDELAQLQKIAKNRPISIINGSVKDLNNYNEHDNSITFCQYQAASMGHNLQKANKIIYFSLPLSCEYWMQSQKRIHRLGQSQPCFYYILSTRDSVDEKIKEALDKGVDFTNALFEK